MKLAGLLSTRDYSDNWRAYHLFESLVDWTAVLDDCSRIPFQHRDDADEYLTLRRGTRWNDVANRTMLMYRAYVNGCDWVLRFDDDILPSLDLYRALRDRRLLPRPEDGESYNGVVVALRDLWGDVTQYRVDGRWAHKTYVILMENWMCRRQVHLPDPDRRLHAAPFPPNGYEVRLKHAENLCLYHFGSLTPQQRSQRVEKYRREDGQCQFQDDYEYLASTEGVTLNAVPVRDVDFMCRWMWTGEVAGEK